LTMREHSCQGAGEASSSRVSRHPRVGRMSRIWYVGMGLALALAGTSAFAFQEEGGAASVAPSSDAKAAAPIEQGLDLTPPPQADNANTGTEVRIPGLGRLGVLPKMDFGLELLYGANEVK